MGRLRIIGCAVALALFAGCGGGESDGKDPACGNGVREAGEACDDGASNSDTAPGACRTTCEAAACGDGVVDPGEACDGGAFCTATCTLEPGCGNGEVEAGEACDDGDGNSDVLADACRTSCAAATCGDGVVDTGESCDDGAGNDDEAPGACRTDCTAAHCGDGVIDPGESCDDGDANSDTEAGACRTTCAPARCGDGVIDAGETCDDGEANSDFAADACRSSCVPASCGDGAVDSGEGCDDGEANSDQSPDACRTSCTAATCGDGIVDSGESCDQGAGNSDTQPGACRTSCVSWGCGDGVIDAGETCDDHNTADGDGCNATCQIEQVCGDAIRNGTEQCDDGNTATGDGCGADCRLEAMVCGASIVDLNARAHFNGPQSFYFHGTMLGAGNDSDGVCSGPNNEDLVLAFWVDHRMKLALTTEAGFSAGQDTVLYVREGNCADPDEEIACNDDMDLDNGIYTSAVTLDDVAPGTQLYFIVDTWGDGDVGIPFTLQGSIAEFVGLGASCDPDGVTSVCDTGLYCDAVSSTCMASICGDNSLSPMEQCDDGNLTTGDGCDASCLVEGGSCSNALVPTFDPVTHEMTVSGTTAGAASDVHPSCNDGMPNADAFVAFTAPVEAAWDFTVNGTFNTILAAQATCGDDSTELACSNDQTWDTNDTMRIRLAAGESVFLVVDGFGAPMTAEGTFTITGTPRPILAAGATCDPTQAANVCDTGLLCNPNTLVCAPPICGNGLVEGNETCDDGGTVAGDGCSASCAWELINETEPNDGPTTAMPIARNQIYTGAITPNDVDYFAITANANETFTVNTFVGTMNACSGGTGSSTDTVLHLYDSDGVTQLQFVWDGGPGNCARLDFTAPHAGTFYVKLREFWPNGGATVNPWFVQLQ